MRTGLGLMRRHVHRQHDEFVVRSARHQPAVFIDDGQSGQRESESTAESARVLVDAIKNQLLPRQIITRKSIENAVSLIRLAVGSTNAVLHFLAIAHSAGVEWTLDDFERCAAKCRCWLI